MKVQHINEFGPVFVSRGSTLIIHLVMSISTASSPFIPFLFINFSGIASPVLLQLLIIIEGVWNIEGLRKIKGFGHAKFIAYELTKHTLMDFSLTKWCIFELLCKSISMQFTEMICNSFSILITAFEPFRLILITQNDLYWWSCSTDNSIYQFDLLIFHSFT